jgi:hypothetical protein
MLRVHCGDFQLLARRWNRCYPHKHNEYDLAVSSFPLLIVDGDHSWSPLPRRLPRKLIAQVTDQVPIEGQPAHDPVYRLGEPVL